MEGHQVGRAEWLSLGRSGERESRGWVGKTGGYLDWGMKQTQS